MADDRERWRGESERNRLGDDRRRYEGAPMRDREQYGSDYGQRHNREGYNQFGYGSQGGWRGRDEAFERRPRSRDDEYRGEGFRNYAGGGRSDWPERNDAYNPMNERRDYGLYDRDRYDQGGYQRSGRYDSDRDFWDRSGDEIASWFGDSDAARRRAEDARRGDPGAQHHRGRGPRNYTRSDERIREDINDRMTDHPVLDATDIEVNVSGGEVTLSGTVDSRYAKRLAEDVADDVSGVKHVQNNLRVGQQQGGESMSGTTNTIGAGISGTRDINRST